jgi:DNA modification methylase
VNTPTSKALNVNYLSPLSLKPYARNARTHSKRQLRQIAESIRSFGFNNPVLIDKESSIIAGHGRVEAAKLLGLAEVPTIQLEHMTEAQRQAYILADNRLGEKAGWDKEILAIELQNIMAVDLDFDITVTGFEMGEIDKLFMGNDEQDDADEVPEPAELPFARVGDLWQLGNHRLYCGNSLEAASYQALLEGQQAHLIFTDPPYNVPINGHVSGLGKTKHEEFAMASGEMTTGEFTGFLEQVFHQMAVNSTDGSLHFVCMDWRHMSELLVAGQKVYDELKNLCVWNKDRGGMGALYRSKHELVFLFKSGKEPHTNNVELGKHGRYRTNIWDYPAVNTWKTGAGSELAMHPTVKPVRMIADAIMDCSNRGDLVLDPFGGSGSTLIAAEKTGRKARLVELEPKYVDVIIQRWERLTKQKAVQLACGVKGS